MSNKKASLDKLTYAGAGVDIDAGEKMVDRIKHDMHRTYGPRVLGKHGGFAGCFRLDYNEKLFKRNYKEPVLISCTDGVGTKVKLAAELKIYDTVGEDLVAMSVNDLIVQGAEPLFFLDYIGINHLDPALGEQLVHGVANGCAKAECALLGGETAEMPDVYAKDDFDLAGFAVGVVELKKIIDGSKAKAGDVLIGLGSSGVHSNGYSLVRAVVKKADLKLDQIYPKLDDARTLGQVLLTPTRIYAGSVPRLLRSYKIKQVVTAMAHITGGGLAANVKRTLSEDLDAHINPGAWPVPAVFPFLQHHGNIDDQEMSNVFNMGIGFVMSVRPHYVDSVVKRLRKSGEQVYVLGKLKKGCGNVLMKKQ